MGKRGQKPLHPRAAASPAFAGQALAFGHDQSPAMRADPCVAEVEGCVVRADEPGKARCPSATRISSSWTAPAAFPAGVAPSAAPSTSTDAGKSLVVGFRHNGLRARSKQRSGHRRAPGASGVPCGIPRERRIAANSSPEQPTRDIMSATTVKPPPSTEPAGTLLIRNPGPPENAVADEIAKPLEHVDANAATATDAEACNAVKSLRALPDRRGEKSIPVRAARVPWNG